MERLEWKTDVLKSRDGSEQRIKLREKPRHSIEYEFLITKDELQFLQVQLLRWQSTRWIIPLWMHLQVLEENVPAGSYRIPVPTTQYYEFQVDSFVFLYAGPGYYEPVKIAAVGPDYIDLIEATTKPFAKRAWIMPARHGRLRDRITLSAITGNTATGVMAATIEDTQPTFFTYDGVLDNRPYTDTEPNRIEPLRMEWQRNMGIIDYGTGPILSYDLHGYTEIVRHFDYAGGRDVYAVIRTYMEFCKGQYKAFLMPTFQADMTPLNAYLASDNYLIIKSINYTVDYYYRVTYPYIRIEFFGGQSIVRKVIQAIELVDGTEQLVLDNNFGRSFHADQVSRVSVVNLCRFDSDALEFQWRTPTYMSTTLPIRSIPE